MDGRLSAVEMEVGTLRERLAAVESKSGDELVSSSSCSVVKEVVGQLPVLWPLCWRRVWRSILIQLSLLSTVL